jgi:6,7-dimethyl-8-ribityllumazine synthase
MATKLKNLSRFRPDLPSAEGMKFGIAVAEWNWKITGALLEGAVSLLRTQGCRDEDILIKRVPGSFELTVAAQFFAEYTDVDAVIVLGCVIQGETRHFEFICQGVTQGVMQVSLAWNMPVIFGVLTTDNEQQALDRAGGKYGNKGDEAAGAAISMVSLQNEMEENEVTVDRQSIFGDNTVN